MKEAISIQRKLATENPAANRHELAGTLDSLGLLYQETQRFAEAGAADKEAMTIQRQLTEQNPRLYRPDSATTLNNLGALYTDTYHFADAEAALTEGASIERELVKQNPVAYRPDLAQTLNNLGFLCLETRHFADSEAALERPSPSGRAGSAEPGRLTGLAWYARLTIWALSTGRHSASPTPRPPSRRLPAFVAR